MSKLSFPPNFTWGSATSSYQIEGAHDLDGKGPSIWDAFSAIPGKIYQNHHGQIACDHYHKMSEDIALMKAMGLKAYRFSISWPRLLPTGVGKPIKEGIHFYSKLIDQLLDNGIEPWVTLYHWDLPLALQFEMDGWLGDSIIDAFESYADLCFEYFGDRVKNWITINEAWVVSMLGYGQGVFAPGRISNEEPYRAAHNLLLAHGKVVDTYRRKYQARQKGRIGITNNCDWREPLSDLDSDKAAAQRALEFFLGWFADPIYRGCYPESMVARVGTRLPKFSGADRALVQGSSDFFGLNHYTTMYAQDAEGQVLSASVYGNGGLAEDQEVNLSVDPSWKMTDMHWAVVPWGCSKLLSWIDQRYDHPEIIITENGCAQQDEKIEGQVVDQERIGFMDGYISACNTAIEAGVNLTGYFAWSLMDNFEWASGYSKRFGLHYVDFDTLERTPKQSAIWYSEVIKNNGILTRLK
jgi:beta-glucosidase